MTIRFVQQWNGYSPDTIVTLAGAEETRLIGLGYAVTDLDGPGNTPLPVASTTNLTGVVEFSDGDVTYPVFAQTPKNQMTTIVVGNSIASACKYTTYYPTSNDVVLANELAGSPMKSARMTATTRMDLFGTYGYSGQTLPTIQTDLEGQVFSQLRTSSVIPDLVIGHSLLENDVASGATSAAMILSLKKFIRDIQARYPGAILLLGTVRPSFSNNTPAIVAEYQATNTYIRTLDNGINLFVADMSGYENPSSPGVPLSGYTDATVHPNYKGGLVNARAWAQQLRRIGTVFKTSYACNGPNMNLSGTGAASGLNVTGTFPTGTTVGGAASPGYYVCTAENPGFLISVTSQQIAGPAFTDLGTFNFGNLSVAPTSFSAFMVAEIVSGGEYLQSFEITPRITDGSGSPFIKHVENQTGDAAPDFQNGDILTVRTPPFIAVTAPISAVNVYGKIRVKLAGGTVVLRILAAGVGLIS